MANKDFKSRYTIEYVYPDAKKESATKSASNPVKKLFFAISILGVLALGYATTVFYPFKQINNATTEIVETDEIENDEIADDTDLEDTALIASDDSQKTPTTSDSDNLVITPKPKSVEKKVEALAQNDEAQKETVAVPPSKEQIEKDKLAKKLDEINKQLLIEKAKNKKLVTAMTSNESRNNELSKLLEDALNKADTADKRYLEALSQLDTSLTAPPEKDRNNKTITDETAHQLPTESDAPTNKNTVDLSNATQSQINVIIAAMKNNDKKTIKKIDSEKKIKSAIKENPKKATLKTATSQVDAIVAAMSNVNQSPTRKISKKETEPSIIIQSSESKKAEKTKPELLYISLQKQINELIITNELQPTSYKKTLSDESKVRNNAVRSITVKKGDTLWDIAERAYGNGSYYKKIIEANPEVSKKGKIYLKEGQIIRVPI